MRPSPTAAAAANIEVRQYRAPQRCNHRRADGIAEHAVVLEDQRLRGLRKLPQPLI